MATAEEYIKSMYDSKKKSTLAGLESAFKQNVGKLDQEDKEAPKRYYDAKRNATAAEGIANLNANERNAMSGLGSGSVGQATLARRNAASRNMANVMQQEADATSDRALKRAELESAYRRNVQSAIADSDFGKANAMFTEYKEGRDLARSQVDKLLAAGVMPSADLITKSGYSGGYVNRLYAAMTR